MNDEDETAFANAFSKVNYGSPKSASKTASRVKAERRAVMTDKQRSKGESRNRTIQMNFRCTPSLKRLATGLSGHMAAQSGKDVSIADMLEQAVELLAKQKGYKRVSDAT
ncbi:hypothetical protein [Hyphomicrobium sp.]|uniref:hypothetical protein n=1 Tax=Hyphomicrobium sp. TaxID=82 RepID=UPI003563611F